MTCFCFRLAIVVDVHCSVVSRSVTFVHPVKTVGCGTVGWNGIAFVRDTLMSPRNMGAGLEPCLPSRRGDLGFGDFMRL